MLQVRDLSVTFKVGSGFFRRRQELVAVQHMSFDVQPGETFAVVGESGSGKSTLARAVMRLIEPRSGSIRLDGEDITHLHGNTLRRLRPKLQMVFQVLRLLALVGLEDHHMQRYPYEFSGGQRQRIAIARAIALQPKLLVLDEAVSALDVSTQNQILNLLEELRQQTGMAYLFISHDLGVVRHIADTVAVTYLGRIVEQGPAERIFAQPAHPYTRALLAAVPIPNPEIQKARRQPPLQGDMPSPLAPPSGCPFHTRCPYAEDICRQVMPEHEPVAGGGSAACHVRPSAGA